MRGVWAGAKYACIIHCKEPINAENLKQIFPEKELRGHSPNFHIHVSVSYLYIVGFLSGIFSPDRDDF